MGLEQITPNLGLKTTQVSFLVSLHVHPGWVGSVSHAVLTQGHNIWRPAGGRKDGDTLDLKCFHM